MSTEVSGLLNYRHLDLSGEARRAVERMEARAQEPASQAMFDALVRPLLSGSPKHIVELGCGTGALARRIAQALPGGAVTALDKSETMIAAARALSGSAPHSGLVFRAADVTNRAELERLAGPLPAPELILSSVTIPYLSDEETDALIAACTNLLPPGGTLAFIEQDLLTDAVNFPDFDLLRRVFDRDGRKLKRTLALGLRPLMRQAGLTLEPRRSFLWTDDSHGPYVRELLGKMADDALAAGRITKDEREVWSTGLDKLATSGDFYYGLVYHAVVGHKPASGPARRAGA